MTIRDLFNKVKYILPFLALPLAVDSNRLARENRQFREEMVKEIQRLMTELNTKQDILMNNLELNRIIANLTNNTSNQLNTVKEYFEKSEILENLFKRLDDPNISVEERDFLMGSWDLYKKQGIEHVNKVNEFLQKILNQINSSGNGDNFISEINLLIERYKEFLSTLSVEQLDIVVNTIGQIIILSFVISLAAVLYGDFLIRYFELEKRFPKIANFIQIRRKFQWYYLNYSFLMIAFFTIFLIWFNISNFYL